MLNDIARDVPMQVKPFLMERLKQYAVRILTGAKVVKFLENGAVVARSGEETTLAGFDTVVLALGAVSVNTLQPQIEGRVSELYVIGDALKARQAIQAIEEGAKTALRI